MVDDAFGVVGILIFYNLGWNNTEIAIFVRVERFFRWITEGMWNYIQEPNKNAYKTVQRDMFKKCFIDTESCNDIPPVA